MDDFPQAELLRSKALARPDDPPAPKRDARAHIDDERPRASCAAVVRGKWVIVRILEAMNRESDSDLSFYMQSYIY